MSLSNDLISQFVKATKDDNATKKETTVYGVTVESNSKMYVKIDGSDLLTPIVTTSELKTGERVTVMIKDHYAMVTGNITAPAASTDTTNDIKLDVQTIVGELANFNLIIADKVSAGELDVELAYINNALIDKASISQLAVVDARITNLNVDELKAKVATIDTALIDKASISDLDVANAVIDVLEVDIAAIETLIGGNLTMDNIQSLVLTTSKVTVDNAFIKDAMIDRVSANKLTAGIVNTNNVNLQSADGAMTLIGSLQQFKDAAGNVRIQIGKDLTGDFTFALYGADGVGQLINQNGITASSVSDGLIVNKMVANDAGISGGKLDIDSVVTSINNGISTIKSTKVYFDNEAQTLDIAFNNLTTYMTDLEGDISTATTDISIAQGEISTLISNTTILTEGGETLQLKDDYSQFKITVGGISSKVNSLETNYGKTLKSTKTQYYLSLSALSLVGGSWSESMPVWTTGKYIWQRLVYVYSDNTEVIGTTVCIQGTQGETGPQGIQGPTGSQGIQGPAGINGQTYYTWVKYADTPTTGMSDLPTGKLYIGLAYNKTTATESTTYTDYSWSLIKGDTGAQGPSGANGQTYYTWIKYADTPTTGITDDPTGKTYMGIAYNKTTATESSVYTDYSWSLIKGATGAQGIQGIQGPTGANGQTYYTWIKYADTPTTGMNDLPDGKVYMGIAYNKTTATESSVYTDYSWSLIKGATGSQGIQGPTGANGQTYYTWIKYADTPTTGMNDLPDGKVYMGIAYNKTTATESSVYTDYSWSLIKGATGATGPQGIQGIQGPTGTNGQTLYTWVKYANDNIGTSMSDLPDGKTYIGLAYNKTTATESTTPSDYSWSLIKGTDGAQGIQGPTGANGQTYYTWIKYATTPLTGMSDDPAGKIYMGIAYNKTTATESVNYADYSWSLIKGDTGQNGTNGTNGQSVTSVTPQFAKHTSSTVAPSPGTWYDVCPAYVAATYLWIRNKVVYANPASTVYTTPYYEASWDAKATAEDAKTTVTTKVSEFQQTLNGFETTVSETYVSKLEATDIESALNSNIDAAIGTAKSDIFQNIGNNYTLATDFTSFSQSVNSKFGQTSSDITASFGIMQNYTKEVDGKLEEFQNTVGTHIRFSVDGMDLGRTDSPFTATLDNQELAFKENGVKVAHIGNNTMNITRAEISDVLRIGELDQGFFTWSQGGNGNMSLKWSDK